MTDGRHKEAALDKAEAEAEAAGSGGNDRADGLSAQRGQADAPATVSQENPPDSAADKLAAAQAERKKLMEQAASCLKGRMRITPEEEADDGYINVKI